MIKTTRIKYSQAPRIIVDDLSPQCDGVKQTFTLSRPVPEWAPYCLVFNGQLYTNTSYKQWFVLDADRKTIHTSFITPPTQGPNKSLILIVGVAGMEDLGVTWDDIVNKPEIPTEEVVDAKDAAVLSESKGYTDGKIGDLATVARTGDYDDLSNKPTIPAAQVNSDWNAASGKAQILNKPTLATVATSGSYNDLSNKPTIPAAQVQSDWAETNTSSKAFIKNKPTVPAAVTVDAALSSTSENPVQNKVINTALNGKQASLSTAQLNAANSGITSAKVSTYDGYASTIAGKANSADVPVITMQTTDPGSGVALAANHFIAVYNGGQ